MKNVERKILAHQEAWDLIPWFVNGRASAEEQVLFENHLQTCSQCRGEVDLQHQVYSSVSQDTGIECMPSVSLQRLWSRIDAPALAAASGAGAGADEREREDEDDEHDSTESVRRSDRRATSARTPRGTRVVRWLIAAVTIESLALATLVLAFGVSAMHRHARRGDYQTVSSPASIPAAATMRVVFAPDMTLEQMHAVLLDAQMSVVSGPSEAGVYSLAPVNAARAQAMQRSLGRLRSNRNVRFAESTVPLAPAAPNSWP
jgi:hypothetical protein